MICDGSHLGILEEEKNIFEEQSNETVK